MIKASVIIPVYNAEKTLKYCIDSILNQTYKDIEIILINDGSIDNTQEILEEYKKEYPEIIQIYSQKNAGISATRNRGMNYAHGEYFFFVDNDDYLDKDYIETFVSNLENTDTEMLVGGYRRVDPDGKILFTQKASDSPWYKFMFITPWARVYKKEALKRNNIEFLVTNIGEDIYFNIQADLKLKTESIDYTGYNWVSTLSSVSNTKHKGLNEEVDIIQTMEATRERIKDFKLSQEERFFLEYFFVKTGIFYLLYSGRGSGYKELKNETERVFKWFEENYPSYMKTSLQIARPKGEKLSTRLVIFIFVFLRRIHLENIFLRIYSRI